MLWDYVGGSSGIIGGHQNNPRAKPGISNETLRSLQAEVLLLADGPVALQSTGRRPGESVELKILLANWSFGGFPAWTDDPQLSWRSSVVVGPPLSNGTVVVQRGKVGQGEVGMVSALGVTMPHVTAASKVVVEVALSIDGATVASNQWQLPVFPKAPPTRVCPVAVLADLSLLPEIRRVCSNAAAVPPSLASQSTPFVLVPAAGAGLTAEAAVALQAAGGFGLLLNPTESWPVCNSSAIGPVSAKPVRYFMPWWMDTGMTGTLVYNSSLTDSWGIALDDGFLDYSWASIVDQAQVYTLDGLNAGTARSVHVRAIPAFCTTGNGASFETAVSNDALVWEGQIPGASEAGAGGRFLVSGLNLLNGTALKPEPAAELMLGRLLSYAVSETAAVARRGVASAADNSGFCAAGAEGPCQTPTVSAGLGNANFEIVSQVHLARNAVVEALHPRLSLRSSASAQVLPVLYSVAAPPANDSSFCSMAPGAKTGSWRLLATGPATELTTHNATWLRLPLTAPTRLGPGTYWIGVLLAADVNCFGVPGGPVDAWAPRPFSSGAGPGVGFQRGSANFAVYASTST